jgi:hypothetical protein
MVTETQSKLAHRCCVCQAIDLEGKLIPKEDYDLEVLKKQGVSFSDGYLSRQCFKDHYEKIGMLQSIPENILGMLQYDSCNVQKSFSSIYEEKTMGGGVNE